MKFEANLTFHTESQPAWNNDTRVPTHDFDELFQMQNGGTTQAKSSSTHDRYRGGNNII